ncbi:MAG: hypothetical protein ACI9H6_000608 [Patiriisocius sp.]|jgi:hypothetical protein
MVCGMFVNRHQRRVAMNESITTSMAKEVALDTLSVLYLSTEHTAQFYIMDGNKTGLYENFLYIAEPTEDPDAVLGVGIISISTNYSHALLNLLFPVGIGMMIPVYRFPEL